MNAFAASLSAGKPCVLVFGAQLSACFAGEQQLTATGAAMRELLRIARDLEVYFQAEAQAKDALQTQLGDDRVRVFDASEESEGTQQLLQRVAEVKHIGICGLRFNGSSDFNRILQVAADSSVHIYCFTPSIFIRQLKQKASVQPTAEQIGQGSNLLQMSSSVVNLRHVIGDINDILPLLLWQCQQIARTSRLFELANLNRGLKHDEKVNDQPETVATSGLTKPTEPSRQSGSSTTGWELVELVWNTTHSPPEKILHQVDTLFRPRRYEVSTNQPKLRDHGGTPRKRKGLNSPYPIAEQSPVSSARSTSRHGTPQHRRQSTPVAASRKIKIDPETDQAVANISMSRLPRWCREEIDAKYPVQRKTRGKRARQLDSPPEDMIRASPQTPTRPSPASRREHTPTMENILSTPPRRVQLASADLDAAAALIFMQNTDSHG